VLLLLTILLSNLSNRIGINKKRKPNLLSKHLGSNLPKQVPKIPSDKKAMT